MLNKSDLLLDAININLLKHFKLYKSKGHNLFCSYMSVGNKYKNELLVVGREPSYWREKFSIEELAVKGPEFIFNTKIRYYADNELNFSHSKQRGKYKISYNPGNDPFWCCVKEIVLELGICENDTNWSSGIALTYLYKIAYCSKTYSSEKLRTTQFEYCKEMFQLELLRLILLIVQIAGIVYITLENSTMDFIKPRQSFPEIQECTNAQSLSNPYLMNSK